MPFLASLDTRMWQLARNKNLMMVKWTYLWSHPKGEKMYKSSESKERYKELTKHSTHKSTMALFDWKHYCKCVSGQVIIYPKTHNVRHSLMFGMKNMDKYVLMSMFWRIIVITIILYSYLIIVFLCFIVMVEQVMKAFYQATNIRVGRRQRSHRWHWRMEKG